MNRREFLRTGAAAIAAAAAKPSGGGIKLSGPTSVDLCPDKSVTLFYQLTKGPGQSLITQFSVSGLPPGVTAKLSPISCKPNCGTSLTLTASADYQPGNYSFLVKAQNTKDVAMANTNITPSTCLFNPPPPSSGNTRLGLHVTNDELAIWQTRAVSGPYKTTSDVQTNSPGDWTRITNNASTFNSDPGAENVKGTGPGVTLSTAVLPCGGTQACGVIFSRDGNSTNDRTNVGVYIRDAAFYCLVKGPNDSTANTYFSKIVTQLLAQAGEAGTDPTNTTHWNINQANDGSPFFTWALFVARYFLAYDYLKAAITHYGTWSISGTDRTTLDTWFTNWAQWFKDLDFSNDKPYGPSGAFTNPTVEPHTLSGTFNTIYNQGFQTAIWGSSGGDGPQPTNIQWWNNRHNECWRMIALVAIGLNIPSLLTPVKVWFRDWIKYAHFINGDLTEMDRARDDNNGAAGLNYASASLGSMLCVADTLARNGDTSLIDYSTLSGDQGFGTNVAGTGKSLFAAVLNFMNYAGTNLFSPKHTCKNAADSGEDMNLNTNGFNGVGDVYLAMGNLYWQDNTIKTTYLRTRAGTFAYPSSPQGVGGDPGLSAYCGGSSFYPGILFMFGNNEGTVDPYP